MRLQRRQMEFKFCQISTYTILVEHQQTLYVDNKNRDILLLRTPSLKSRTRILNRTTVRINFRKVLSITRRCNWHWGSGFSRSHARQCPTSFGKRAAEQSNSRTRSAFARSFLINIYKCTIQIRRCRILPRAQRGGIPVNQIIIQIKQGMSPSGFLNREVRERSQKIARRIVNKLTECRHPIDTDFPCFVFGIFQKPFDLNVLIFAARILF